MNSGAGFSLRETVTFLLLLSILIGAVSVSVLYFIDAMVLNSARSLAVSLTAIYVMKKAYRLVLALAKGGE